MVCREVTTGWSSDGLSGVRTPTGLRSIRGSTKLDVVRDLSLR
jgi:hypothetical protein